jgi:hypothetical protein
MKYILEFFSFSKKTPKEDWRSKFDKVYKYYNSVKLKSSKGIHYFNSVVRSKDSFDVVLDSIHIGFSNRNGKFEVIDFEDYSFGIEDKESKGKYYINEVDWNEYLMKTQEMSDFMDKDSEIMINKSGTIVSDDGIKLGFDESDTALAEINYQLQKEFDKYIDKEFEFEIQYYLWSENNKNEVITERINLPILDIRIEFSDDRFYSEIETKGVQNEKCILWLEDNKYKYVDLEGESPDYDQLISMDKVKEKLTRKQERDQVNKYPNITSYEVTPSKYNTIEFINTITEILQHLNEELKKRE